jgi:pentose-5-phosphate-3-epimerase
MARTFLKQTIPGRAIQMSPSLLSADFMNLERDVRMLEGFEQDAVPGVGQDVASDTGQSVGQDVASDANQNVDTGAAKSTGGYQPPEWLHVDVMDGHFVPNLTIGPPCVRALKNIASTPLDVHLMISNPAEQLDWFIEAGADLITVHIECATRPQIMRSDAESTAPSAPAATPDVGSTPAPLQSPTTPQFSILNSQFSIPAPSAAPGESRSIQEVENPELIHSLISRIHAAGRKAGLSLNPGTPAEAVFPFLDTLDLVLVMSVHPGFGGQSFIPESVEKITAIAEAAQTQNPALLIEVDGGINVQTAPLVVAAGATMLVAGNAVFGAPDPQAALQAIRDAAEQCRQGA